MAEKRNKREADSVSINKLVEGSHVLKVTGHSSLMIRTPEHPPHGQNASGQHRSRSAITQGPSVIIPVVRPVFFILRRATERKQ